MSVNAFASLNVRVRVWEYTFPHTHSHSHTRTLAFPVRVGRGSEETYTVLSLHYTNLSLLTPSLHAQGMRVYVCGSVCVGVCVWEGVLPHTYAHIQRRKRIHTHTHTRMQTLKNLPRTLSCVWLEQRVYVIRVYIMSVHHVHSLPRLPSHTNRTTV